MGDVADVSSNVPLPEDVVYTQRVEDTEEAREVEEEQVVPEKEKVNKSENPGHSPEELGRNIDVRA